MKFDGYMPYEREVSTDNPFKWFSWSSRPIYWDEDIEFWTTATFADTNAIFGSVLEPIVARQVTDFAFALSNMNKISGYKTFYPLITSILDYTQVQTQSSILYEFPEIKANNQPAYSKSVGDRSVIVSPYQKGKFEVTFKPGRTASGKGRTIDYSISIGKFILGIPENGEFTYGGRRWRDAPSVVFTRQSMTYTEFTQYSTFDPEVFAAQFLQSLTPVSDKVTECVVSANGGTVDLATSLAEIPEAVHGIMSGVTAIVKLYKDARKGELRIKDQVKNVRTRWDRTISRLENAKIRDDAAVLTAKRQQEKDVNNLLHAIAGVWLTYRLSIYPMAKTIESTIDGLVLGYANSEFVRFRERSQYELEFPDGSLTCTFRAFIKRSIISGAGWQNFFSVNLFRTAWELVPLSFVLDRYIGIGDWITANLSSPGDFTLAEGATLSWIVNDVMSTDLYELDMQFVRRELFSPDNYCQLTFPDSRSTYQSLDHLALAWSILTKKV